MSVVLVPSMVLAAGSGFTWSHSLLGWLEQPLVDLGVDPLPILDMLIISVLLILFAYIAGKPFEDDHAGTWQKSRSCAFCGSRVGGFWISGWHHPSRNRSTPDSRCLEPTGCSYSALTFQDWSLDSIHRRTNSTWPSHLPWSFSRYSLSRNPSAWGKLHQTISRPNALLARWCFNRIDQSSGETVVLSIRLFGNMTGDHKVVLIFSAILAVGLLHPFHGIGNFGVSSTGFCVCITVINLFWNGDEWGSLIVCNPSNQQRKTMKKFMLILVMMAAAAPLYAAQGDLATFGIALGRPCHFPGSTGRRHHRVLPCAAHWKALHATPMPQIRSSPRWSSARTDRVPRHLRTGDRHSSGKIWFPCGLCGDHNPLPVPKPKIFRIFHESASRSGTLVPDEADDAFLQTDASISEKRDSWIPAPWEELGVCRMPWIPIRGGSSRSGLEGLREVRPVLSETKGQPHPGQGEDPPWRFLIDADTVWRSTDVETPTSPADGLWPQFHSSAPERSFSFHALSMNKPSAEARSSKRTLRNLMLILETLEKQESLPEDMEQHWPVLKTGVWTTFSASRFHAYKRKAEGWLDGFLAMAPEPLPADTRSTWIRCRSPASRWYSIWNNPAKNVGFPQMSEHCLENMKEHQQWLGKACNSGTSVWEAFKPTSPPRRRSGCWWGSTKEWEELPPESDLWSGFLGFRL